MAKRKPKSTEMKIEDTVEEVNTDATTVVTDEAEAVETTEATETVPAESVETPAEEPEVVLEDTGTVEEEVVEETPPAPEPTPEPEPVKPVVKGDVPVQIKVLKPEAVLPEYKTEGSAGFDLVSTEDLNVMSGETAIVSTGLAMAVPTGYEIQVRPRSGLAANHGVTVLNSPGTIDSDYRGELMVILHNTGKKFATFRIAKGDRIAQGVLSKVPTADFQVVDELDGTERGDGKFGSTGK